MVSRMLGLLVGRTRSERSYSRNLRMRGGKTNFEEVEKWKPPARLAAAWLRGGLREPPLPEACPGCIRPGSRDCPYGIFILPAAALWPFPDTVSPRYVQRSNFGTI